MPKGYPRFHEQPDMETWENYYAHYDNRCSPTSVTAVAQIGALGIASLCHPYNSCPPYFAPYSCYPYQSCTPTYVYSCYPRSCFRR
ncbi:MAG: hypothetical protein H6Q75_936 [Firmicutes bacterium]|nr:hypothetical protein [Bacillota bacterium]